MTPDLFTLYTALTATEITYCLVAQQAALQAVLDDHAAQLAAIHARLEAQVAGLPSPTPAAVRAYEAWRAQQRQR
jgi:hypothetical protein